MASKNSNELWVVTKNGNFQKAAANKDVAVSEMRTLAGVDSGTEAVDYKDGTGLKGVKCYRARLTPVIGRPDKAPKADVESEPTA